MAFSGITFTLNFIKILLAVFQVKHADRQKSMTFIILSSTNGGAVQFSLSVLQQRVMLLKNK